MYKYDINKRNIYYYDIPDVIFELQASWNKKPTTLKNIVDMIGCQFYTKNSLRAIFLCEMIGHIININGEYHDSKWSTKKNVVESLQNIQRLRLKAVDFYYYNSAENDFDVDIGQYDNNGEVTKFISFKLYNEKINTIKASEMLKLYGKESLELLCDNMLYVLD